MQTSKQVGKQAGRQAYRRASRHAVKIHGKLFFSIAAHENHVKMQAAGPVAIGMILPAVKMHGKLCFSIAVHENQVKMQAAGPNAIDPIQAGCKNAWEIMFFKSATCTCQLRHRKTM